MALMRNRILYETVDPSSDLIVLACSIMLAKINISKCLINIGEAKIAADSSAKGNYQGLPDIVYPFHGKIIVVTNCGRLRLAHKNQFQNDLCWSGGGPGRTHMHRYSLLASAQKVAIAQFLVELPKLVELGPEDQKVVERAVRNYWGQYLKTEAPGEGNDS
jgi:hypothetical protein